MPASFVLASLRGSTYRSVRLASSLAAAALDGHFEHPAATEQTNKRNRITLRHWINERYDEEYKRLFKGANVFEREKMEPLLVSFLRDHPDYAPALRLRGMMIEYEVALEQSQDITVESYDPRLEIMRKSYEDALQANPCYILAAIDLGDYWNDFADHPEVAIEYYDRAILLLKSGQGTEDRETELRDAYKGKIQALIALDKKDAAARCRAQAMVDCRADDFADLKIPDGDAGK